MSKSQNKSEEASSFYDREQQTRRLIAVPRKEIKEKRASDTSLVREFPLMIIVIVLALVMYFLSR